MQPISTKIFQTATVPWDRHHMRVGKGYDVYHSEPLATPFDLIELPRYPPTDIDIIPSRHVLRNESDRQKLSSARVSASASFLPSVVFEAVASALKTATCNETNITVVTSCTIDCPPENFEHLLKLNETSSACLNIASGGAERFTQWYGEYCITGYARQATFTAVSEYRTENKAALEAFAASLDGSAVHGPCNLGANMAMLDATRFSSHKIYQTHNVHISGYNAENGLYKTFRNVDVSRMWEDFLANMSPVPHVATIQHYSTIIPDKIPRPTAVIDLPTDVIDTLRDCTDLRSKAQSNPLRCAKRLAEDLARIENLLLEMRKHVSINTSQLGSLQIKLEVLREEVELYQKRATLLKLLEQEKKRDSEAKSKRWTKSPDGKVELFVIGLTPSTAEDLFSQPSISADLQKSSQVFIRHDTGANPICQYGTFPMAVPGRKVVGAEIMSNRRDHGSNGWWARREGGIGENQFGVEFSSEHYHGAEWRVTVWSIDGGDDGVYGLGE